MTNKQTATSVQFLKQNNHYQANKDIGCDSHAMYKRPVPYLSV